MTINTNITDVNEIQGIRDVVVVDDGSGEQYREIFRRVSEILPSLGGTLLTHDVNRGKGRALKTAFSLVLDQYPCAAGAVTADSDGQHTVGCIRSVMRQLEETPGSLILGVRSFDQEDVPWKSAFGNKLTRKILSYVSGVSVSDTQTGLRGIPLSFITVYDSKENHQTHFNPVKDSIRIYRILGARFFKYIFVSLSSSVVDLALFAAFCSLLRGRALPLPYVAVSTVAARILSATYNFSMNYRVVFQSGKNVGSSAAKYVLLAVIQMVLSAVLVTGGTTLLPLLPEVVVKIVTDTILFLVSYYIQRRYVF